MGRLTVGRPQFAEIKKGPHPRPFFVTANRLVVVTTRAVDVAVLKLFC